MELAGRYAAGKQNSYVPDIFPNQKLMHALANQTNDLQLKDALLTYQYPFKAADLKTSGYSPEVQKIILDATSGRLGW